MALDIGNDGDWLDELEEGLVGDKQDSETAIQGDDDVAKMMDEEYILTMDDLAPEGSYDSTSSDKDNPSMDDLAQRIEPAELPEGFTMDDLLALSGKQDEIDQSRNISHGMHL